MQTHFHRSLCSRTFGRDSTRGRYHKRSAKDETGSPCRNFEDRVCSGRKRTGRSFRVYRSCFQERKERRWNLWFEIDEYPSGTTLEREEHPPTVSFIDAREERRDDSVVRSTRAMLPLSVSVASAVVGQARDGGRRHFDTVYGKHISVAITSRREQVGPVEKREAMLAARRRRGGERVLGEELLANPLLLLAPQPLRP